MNTSWFQRLGSSKLGQRLMSRTFKRAVIGIFFFTVLSVLVAVDFLPEQIPFEEGQVAPKDIYSPKSVEFTDQIATEELKKKAAQTILPVYDLDANVADTVQNNVDSLFQTVKEIRAKSELDEAAKHREVAEALAVKLQDAALEYLLTEDFKLLDELQATISSVLRQSLAEGIEEEKLDTRKEQIILNLEELKLNEQAEAIAKATVNKLLLPNKIYNETETQRRIEAARNSVSPVIKSIQQEQRIVGKGDIVTADTIQKLTAVGLYRQESSGQVIVGIMLMMLVSMGLILLFLRQFYDNIYQSEKLLVLIGLIGFTTLLITRMVLAINFEDYPTLSAQFGYVAPVAASSMLLAILVNGNLAVIATIVLSIWVGILANMELRFMTVGIVTGLTAILSVSKLSQRSDLAKTGFVNVGFAAALTILALSWINNMDFSIALASAVGMGLMNGVLSAVLTGGFLPYLEAVFGLTSPVKLLELSNPNHPLLRKLLLEAPGTYHHSIIVGNLAEAAANEIGAEPLLVRAGAYFHDIGKIKRPYFFIENQLTAENPHDKIAPSLSTLIINSHVKDGVDLAREHKLPETLVDMICQHHGTQLVSYFYHKAKECDKNETVLESDYRYDGPKPQTREAALIMLADSVEAAVRSLKAPTLGRLEGLVRQIIKDKLDDGQLDECDLTFKDLDKVAQSFMKVLAGIFHNRIEYPDQMIKEMERRKK